MQDTRWAARKGFALDIQTLREFIVLSTDKSYSSAARELNMSHTTLYRHMCALETELGKRLILSTNPVILTAAGKTVLKRAGNIVSELDGMRRELDEIDARLSGDVRLLDMSPQNDSMPPISGVLFKLRNRHPGLNPMLVGSSSGLDVITAVREGKLDIGFRYYWHHDRHAVELPADALHEQGVEPFRLQKLRFELRFAIGPAHPLYDESGGTFADYARIGFNMPVNRIYRDSTDPFIAFCHDEGITPKIRYVETDSLLNMWLNGPGNHAFIVTESMLPVQMLPREFSEQIRVVPLEDGPYWMEIYAVTRRGNLSEATATVLAALIEELN